MEYVSCLVQGVLDCHYKQSNNLYFTNIYKLNNKCSYSPNKIVNLLIHCYSQSDCLLQLLIFPLNSTEVDILLNIQLHL